MDEGCACRCGDPASTNAGTIVEAGGLSQDSLDWRNMERLPTGRGGVVLCSSANEPSDYFVSSSAEVAARARDTAKAMEEIRAWTVANEPGWAQGPDASDKEERSVMDVAEELDASPATASWVRPDGSVGTTTNVIDGRPHPSLEECGGDVREWANAPGAGEPQEAPKPAELPSDASASNAAVNVLPAAQETVCASLGTRKVPLGALIASGDGAGE
jgi:hypothetical protein